ncbi:DUF2218 domain-containing protein [Martelella sp. HB161492]|uniref:DUF2218 domain-containing protein n=1 Tax=Martelella sp. HB161492 TaxID=2720726 RepID=UPI0015910A02|nr:DUF2218 domain-containing protein [Martelella sp. HB161492]
MNDTLSFQLAGVARTSNAGPLLDRLCDHFSEQADVQRTGDHVRFETEFGLADIVLEEGSLKLAVVTKSAQTLQLAHTMLAEHLYYLSGESDLELTWSQPPARSVPVNLHEVQVVSTEAVTPHMLRVKFSCEDVTPFIGGNIHVRLLIPPKEREPAWPVVGHDGRIKWPDGDDALLVRVYTIRFVDVEKRELWVDFLQHPASDIVTPGADFARNAKPGDRAAFLGPGGGGIPEAEQIFLAGDEAALPAIARIALEAPVGSHLKAIIEVENETEEQAIESAADLDICWLHRASANGTSRLACATQEAIAATDAETFIWVACERTDIKGIRQLLKDRQHDRKKTYVAWYWERSSSAAS